MSSEAAWEAGSPEASGTASLLTAEAEGLTPRSDKNRSKQHTSGTDLSTNVASTSGRSLL